MARLARPVSSLGHRYDAIVVGSGYGGGVAALRLARLGFSVAVLEQGRELAPGDFPTDPAGLVRELRWLSGGRLEGAEDGLLTVDVTGDVAIVEGSGLGGGSLIGAGVAMSPDVLVFEDDRWPVALRTDHYLSLGFGRAKRMLAPRPLPAGLEPRRYARLAGIAQGVGREIERLPLAIRMEAEFAPSRPPADTPGPCTGCGACLSGCNLGAMTTVRSSYLADARQHGAMLFTGARVRYIEPGGAGGWRVVLATPGEPDRRVPLRAVDAGLVVIAAGTRGTVEILARSRYRGLPLSRRLGQSFSPDAHLVLAATDGARRAARQSGLDAAGSGPPGPAVTAALDLRRRRDKAERSIVTDLGLPQALVRLLAERRKMAAADAVGSDAKAGAETAASDADMLARSFVLYACGLDGGTGAFEAAGDGVRAVLSQPAAEARAQMRALVEGLVAPAPGARSAAAPGIEPAASRPVALDIDGRALTIGPLGGAVMGDTSEAGVVDHRGRVFDARPGARPGSLLPGLLVLDGSIVPRPIGCPPMLTITALAERAMILLERDMGVRHHSDRSAPAEGLSGADARGEVT